MADANPVPVWLPRGTWIWATFRPHVQTGFSHTPSVRKKKSKAERNRANFVFRLAIRDVSFVLKMLGIPGGGDFRSNELHTPGSVMVKDRSKDAIHIMQAISIQEPSLLDSNTGVRGYKEYDPNMDADIPINGFNEPIFSKVGFKLTSIGDFTSLSQVVRIYS
ncbi:hypothetical protein DFH06DRAFT_1151855 [Mycena polygramma]|nr:hypothetical protein DFH06DRAFT_1151855 [Mycena polygramma]